MKTTHLLAILAFAPLLASAQQAQMKLPDLFGDHAIVQRSGATAVWGRAAPGETVTVTLGGARAEARAADISAKASDERRMNAAG